MDSRFFESVLLAWAVLLDDLYVRQDGVGEMEGLDNVNRHGVERLFGYPDTPIKPFHYLSHAILPPLRLSDT